MANILWIEDEADKIGGLVRPLIKDGHNIIVALNKEDALKKINNHQIDLIILDIIIPDGDVLKKDIESYVGIKLLEIFRKNNANVPIIVLTVVNDENTLNEIRNYGVTKILKKGAYLPSNLRSEIYDTLGIIK